MAGSSAIRSRAPPRAPRARPRPARGRRVRSRPQQPACCGRAGEPSPRSLCAPERVSMRVSARPRESRPRRARAVEALAGRAAGSVDSTLASSSLSRKTTSSGVPGPPETASADIQPCRRTRGDPVRCGSIFSTSPFSLLAAQSVPSRRPGAWRSPAAGSGGAHGRCGRPRARPRLRAPPRPTRPLPRCRLGRTRGSRGRRPSSARRSSAWRCPHGPSRGRLLGRVQPPRPRWRFPRHERKRDAAHGLRRATSTSTSRCAPPSSAHADRRRTPRQRAPRGGRPGRPPGCRGVTARCPGRRREPGTGGAARAAASPPPPPRHQGRRQRITARPPVATSARRRRRAGRSSPASAARAAPISSAEVS